MEMTAEIVENNVKKIYKIYQNVTAIALLDS